jgi:hypothetical protein
MKLAGEQLLSAPRERVWQLLNDPESLSRLIPGCQALEQLSPNEFAGSIIVGIAAIKGTYAGKLRLEEIRPPEHYRLNVDGKGKQGFMRGAGTLDLAPYAANSDQTVVKYAGDVQVGGTLMQVGQRVIGSAAKVMLGQFFAAAEAELKAQTAGTIARQGVLINFWRYLLTLIRRLFRVLGSLSCVCDTPARG